MKKEEISFLTDAFNSLEDAVLRLKRFYEIHDKENFLKTKKAMLEIQKEIEGVLNNEHN
jgi:hypothetical protein